ncbi:ribonuclease HII [Formosa sediminum]|uniref:Ribonuclease HII n=1 Tax=Formosa sediminum TaxID=2594004 RepID=A0A516GMF6_9FLAO|nr:ribonuclease HII [Formosa sediminum]QDO92716.1 ribonuclease HII [Formosa sediminum]
MRALFLAIIFSLFLISCDTNTKTHQSLLAYVPKHTSTLIKTNNLENLKSSLTNNVLVQEFKTAKFNNSLNTFFKTINVFSLKEDILFCFSKAPADSSQITLITKYNTDFFQFDSLSKPKQEQIRFKNNIITKTELNQNNFYSVIIDSIFIGSTSKSIIEQSLEPQPISPELQKIYNTTSTEKTFAVIIDTESVENASLFMSTDSIPIKKFTKYLALDTDITQDQITINGITKANDSTNYLIDVFKNTIPQENKMAQITPEESEGFLSITYQDFNNLQANFIAYNNLEPEETTLFDNTNEIGIIYNKEHRAIVMYSLDNMATNDALLDSQDIIESFRQVDIKQFTHPEWFPKHFSPIIKTETASFYAVLDSFFVFADSIELLQSIIAAYQNKATYSERSFYQNITPHLSDASSLMLVGNSNVLNDILQTNFKTDATTNTSPFKVSAIQYIYDHDFAHVNGIIKRNKTKATENSVNEELNIKLDAKLLNKPQFVTNHSTGEKEVVVQDIHNNLYLISNKGKVLWKKELSEAIIGDISQIDMYRNGRLQLAFTTAHHLYVLDRNGNPAKSYPKTFRDKVTQPLSVFDYDSNKRYRLVVVQNKGVLMYDAQGNIVNGFTYKEANQTIIHQPQHFRIGRKDYLVFKTSDQLYILSRTGEVRVTPKSSYSYSNEGVYIYNNKFTTTTDEGDLILVDENGRITSENLNLGENHHIVATSRTLVTQSENKLNIKNKALELDFGNYSPVSLFYINNKIYITTTDLQTQKVYVFDSQGETVSNFPVYGASSIDMANTDKDNHLEIVTKGDDNAIIIYQIN